MKTKTFPIEPKIGPKLKPAKTKITKRYGFDNMRLDANLPSGATLSYRAGRTGTKLEIAFSNDDATLKLQMKLMSAWLKFRKNETHQNVFDRLEKVLQASKSGAEVINNLKNF